MLALWLLLKYYRGAGLARLRLGAAGNQSYHKCETRYPNNPQTLRHFSLGRILPLVPKKSKEENREVRKIRNPFRKETQINIF